MDGECEKRLPSTLKGVFMDGECEKRLPSTLKGVFMDGRGQKNRFNKKGDNSEEFFIYL
jgi:hypothetical protein